MDADRQTRLTGDQDSVFVMQKLSVSIQMKLSLMHAQRLQSCFILEGVNVHVFFRCQNMYSYHDTKKFSGSICSNIHTRNRTHIHTRTHIRTCTQMHKHINKLTHTRTQATATSLRNLWRFLSWLYFRHRYELFAELSNSVSLNV